MTKPKTRRRSMVVASFRAKPFEIEAWREAAGDREMDLSTFIRTAIRSAVTEPQPTP
jgi:hypothetical protein